MSKRRAVLVLLGNASKGHTSKWAQHFADIGWSVHLLTFEPVDVPGVEVVPLRNRIGKGRYLAAVPQVRRVIRTVRPEIVHAHYATGYGLLGALSSFRPYILSVWGSDVYEYPRRSPLHAQLLRHNLGAADYLCSTSRAMARETERYTRTPIAVTPFGIHCDRFYPRLERKAEGPLVIGTVKTLEPPYGVEFLVKAFAEVVRRIPKSDLRLEIGGDGISRASLERLAEAEGIGHLTTFFGQIPQAEVPKFLRRFDVYVALSLRESFGVAVLEAAASGIPVVTTNVDGLPEVVADGLTGLLVPPRDPSAAADVLVQLLHDRTRREELGAAGRAFVLERYEWGRTARIMETVYSAALDRRSPQELVSRLNG